MGDAILEPWQASKQERQHRPSDAVAGLGDPPLLSHLHLFFFSSPTIHLHSHHCSPSPPPLTPPKGEGLEAPLPIPPPPLLAGSPLPTYKARSVWSHTYRHLSRQPQHLDPSCEVPAGCPMGGPRVLRGKCPALGSGSLVSIDCSIC